MTLYNLFIDYGYDGIKYIDSFGSQEEAEAFKENIHQWWRNECYIKTFTLNSVKEASGNIPMKNQWEKK